VTVAPLLHGLFDDAALFPPGNATMPDAVAGQLALGSAWYADLVGRFVCPASRLTELDAELGRAGAGPLGVSMTVPDGLDALAEAVRSPRSLPMVDLLSVEVPVPAELPAPALAPLAELVAGGVGVFAELPAAELTPAVAGRLAEAGIALKLRTGGTTQAAFPSRQALAGAVSTAVAAQLPFKCTAGLHHAVRHTDPATGLTHHGFLNVLLAVWAAQSGGDPAEQLAVDDPRTVGERAAALSAAEVTGVRRQLRSIGTCSVAEPLADLHLLGLVGAR
jgi:hypothetical protein